MLTDPQTITIAGTTTSLPNLFREGRHSEYSNPDATIVLKTDQRYGKRIRRSIRLDLAKRVASPDVPTNNTGRSAAIEFVFNVPDDNTYTPAEMLAAYKGFVAQLAAATDKVIIQVLGGEN